MVVDQDRLNAYGLRVLRSLLKMASPSRSNSVIDFPPNSARTGGNIALRNNYPRPSHIAETEFGAVHQSPSLRNRTSEVDGFPVGR